jgi:hypothetical protein
MRWNDVITLVTPGGTITFNQTGVADYYWLLPSQCSGLDQAPIRRTVYDKPQDRGAITFPGTSGARPIVIVGDVVAQSGIATSDSMLAALLTACESLVGATGTLTHGTRDWTVYGDVPFESRDASFAPGSVWKGFIFGLLAPDPVAA